jgi:hypothetical protein
MLNPAHDDQAPENRALAALPKMPSVSVIIIIIA